jgi:preprotein translocase subunit SecD
VKATHWRLLLIGVVIALTGWFVWPREDRPILNLNLGLDLKGGSHLMMRVVTEDAVRAQADIEATRLGEQLRTEGFPDARATVEQPGEIVITGIAPERLGEAELLIDEEVGDWTVEAEQERLVVRMPPREIEYLETEAVDQAVSTIRNRVNELGVREMTIQKVRGGNGDRILIQMPGVEDPSRVKGIIQSEARLEFVQPYFPPAGGAPYQGLTREDVLAQFGGQLPPGVRVLPQQESQPDQQEVEAGERQIVQWMALEKSAVVTGSDLRQARATTDQYGQNAVSVQLNVEAGQRMRRHTQENVGNQMAIVLDDVIISAPVIRDRFGDQFQITGGFTPTEARDLGIKLKAGALPARIITIEERTVGPSLGLDSIRAGIYAALLGFALVMVFMVLYYKLSGINAVIALLLNVLIIAAIMVMVEATLTLPGIGGFILTVGMAVDANVLIFERIREEMRAGKTVRGSLDGGFGKALSAIIDANITTLIGAVLLFTYGTGPVRGFAVTLTFGILASMFTAIFVSRTIFDLVLGERPVKTLSI